MKWRGRWYFIWPWKKFFSNLFSTWEKCVSLNCGNFCRTTHVLQKFLRKNEKWKVLSFKWKNFWKWKAKADKIIEKLKGKSKILNFWKLRAKSKRGSFMIRFPTLINLHTKKKKKKRKQNKIKKNSQIINNWLFSAVSFWLHFQLAPWFELPFHYTMFANISKRQLTFWATMVEVNWLLGHPVWVILRIRPKLM